MSLRELVAEPFGPYPDSAILSEKCKSSTKGMVALSSLSLECCDSPIGFDESESFSAARTSHPVRFYGVVVVKFLAWLTPVGRKWLEIDLKKRDIEKGMHPEVNPVSKLTLEGLYGTRDSGGGVSAGGIFGEGMKSHLRVKVWIQGEKNLSVAFLTSTLLPTGLLLTSKDKNRQYEVSSMDVGTYKLSQNFLARYRLLALMEDIVKSDPQQTPIADRTIDYFVTHYIERHAFTEHHLHHRDIYDSGESDSEHGNTRTPRHARHLPRSEVFDHFAAQSEWILADQLAKRNDKKVVDIGNWFEFCTRVRKERRSARSHNRRWGVPYGELNEEDFKDGIDFSRYPMFGKNLPRLLDAWKRRQSAKTAASHSDDEVNVIESDDELPQVQEDVPLPEDLEHYYDSDFSEESTPPALDSEPDADPPDPELVALVPSQFWHPPVLPVAGFVWHCPVPACVYTIDMLGLTDSNVAGLHESDVHYLRGKRWSSLHEDGVVKSFHRMVSNHWIGHLAKSGIRLNRQKIKCPLEWTHPKQHRPWPP